MDGFRIDSEVAIAVPGEALFDLVRNLSQYAEIEPSVISARWISAGDPGPGSVAEVVTDIPFTVGLVRRALGSPRGTATVVSWRPPTGLAANFDGRLVSADVAVQLRERDGRQVATVTGLIRPHRRWVIRLLSPLRSPLEVLITRSIERGARRIEAALV